MYHNKMTHNAIERDEVTVSRFRLALSKKVIYNFLNTFHFLVRYLEGSIRSRRIQSLTTGSVGT